MGLWYDPYSGLSCAEGLCDQQSLHMPSHPVRQGKAVDEDLSINNECGVYCLGKKVPIEDGETTIEQTAVDYRVVVMMLVTLIRPH